MAVVDRGPEGPAVVQVALIQCQEAASDCKTKL